MAEFMAEMTYFDFLPSQWGGQIKLIIGEEGHRSHSAFTRVWGVPDTNNDHIYIGRNLNQLGQNSSLGYDDFKE